MNTSQAAFPDLHELIRLFYARTEDLGEFTLRNSGTLPAVYGRLLDHNHHMTVTVESHHGCPVDVEVLQVQHVDDTYCRKILLRRKSDGRVVMFGIVRLHTGYLSEEVRSEIEAEGTPLGRVLIEHNVLRRVELGKLWEVIPHEELQRHFNMDSTAVTFGRTAIIHCDGEPAIELVEIVAPEAVE